MISKDLIIYGAGLHARKVSKAFAQIAHNIHGFATSKPGKLEEVDEIPIYSIDNIPNSLREKCQLVCGVFNRTDAYIDLAATASKNGFKDIAWPWDYYPLLHNQLGWCYWLDSQPKSLSDWQNDQGYDQLCTQLADEESRVTLNRIIDFRSGRDLGFSSFRSSDSQYFNSISLGALPADQPISFLDIGAFNGDTLQSLRSHRRIGKAILFEPDSANYLALTQTIKHFIDQAPDMKPLALPLGAGETFGSFSMSGEGEASSMTGLDHQGNTTERSVTVVPIDDAIPTDCFDFVKIDVEGNDLAAIKGMKNLLRRSQPVLAVSLYHRPKDIVELPLAIMTILSGIPYSYYIRQHMNNSFESVLYAIPDSQKTRRREA
jgi:FkbM family methyltransferase